MLPSLLYDNGKPKYPRAMGNSAELRADLGLDALLDAMSGGGGPHAREAAKGVIFEHPAITGENILFRQEILKDALNNADIFTELSDMLESGLAAYEDARKKSQPGYARFIPVSELLRSAAEL
ncbi:MAG: hypothetical protein FWF44_05345, partial [Defluviitaleaceae bacterium]|nr:hypothetical protein [Defluviitaleaceae bacterium]